MIISIRKGATPEEIDRLIQQGSKPQVTVAQQGIRYPKTRRYVKWKQDLLAYQQDLRSYDLLVNFRF